MVTGAREQVLRETGSGPTSPSTALPLDVSAQAELPGPGQPKNDFPDVRQEIQAIEARVDHLERLAQPEPGRSGSEIPAISQPIDKPESCLEDLLPAIKDLALRAGGLDKLAELIATLQHR